MDNKNYSKLINDELYDAIEEQDFTISSVTKQDDNILIEISQYSPQGEDWYETIWVNPDDTLSEVAEAFKEYADNFDHEEAAALFIEGRGKNGIPESITDLLEDARWKKDVLTELGDKLKEAFDGRTESLLKKEAEKDMD
jgi:hypothetical protein